MKDCILSILIFFSFIGFSSASDEIILELQDLGQVTGIVIDPKTKKIIKAKGVKVILQIDKSNRRGWSIKKAYPIK